MSNVRKRNRRNRFKFLKTQNENGPPHNSKKTETKRERNSDSHFGTFSIDIFYINKYEPHIHIQGLDNAGKTTILNKMNGEDITKIAPTLGFNIKTLSFKGFKLNMWDVGGQKTIRAYWRNYFEKTDGLIWVVDSADKIRLETCKKELFKLLDQERLAGASLLIFANKQDLAGAEKEKDIAKLLELDTNAKFHKRHWKIQACSAVTGDGLLSGLDWMVKDIASRIFLFE